MRTCSLLLFACILSFTIFSITEAQPEGWTIITSSHDTLQLCSIGSMEEKMVTFNCRNNVIRISVDSVQSLSKKNESHLWSNIGMGGIIGSATGAMLIGPSLKFGTQDAGSSVLAGALIGAGIGSLMGGIYNLASSDIDTFDLSHETTEDRIKIFRDLRRMDR